MQTSGPAAVATTEVRSDSALANRLGGQQDTKDGTVLAYWRGDSTASVLFGSVGVADAERIPVHRLVAVEELPPSFEVSTRLLTAMASLARVPTWNLAPQEAPPGYAPVSPAMLWMHYIQAATFQALVRLMESVRPPAVCVFPAEHLWRSCILVCLWLQPDVRSKFLGIAEERGMIRPLFRAALQPVPFPGFPNADDVALMVQSLSERLMEEGPEATVSFRPGARTSTDLSSSVLHASATVPADVRRIDTAVEQLRVRLCACYPVPCIARTAMVFRAGLRCATVQLPDVSSRVDCA